MQILMKKSGIRIFIIVSYCNIKKKTKTKTKQNNNNNNNNNNNTLWPLFTGGVQLPRGYRAISRTQFTFYHQVPRKSWYSFDQPRKDERLSRPWSEPKFTHRVTNSKWSFLFFSSELLTRQWKNKSLTFELVTRSEI